MYKKTLLFIEKKLDIIYIFTLVLSFLYIFIIEKITFNKNVLSIHFFNTFKFLMITRGILSLMIIVLIGTIQIRNGKLSLRSEKNRT